MEPLSHGRTGVLFVQRCRMVVTHMVELSDGMMEVDTVWWCFQKEASSNVGLLS